MIVEHGPNLILGRGPCPRPTIEGGFAIPPVKFSGIFTWELIRNGSTIRKGEMRNLITDAGLDAMATTNPITSTQFIAVGTGSTAPANGQTALVAELGRTSARSTGDKTVTSGTAFAYWSMKQVYIFLETEVNGNLTEVGLFNQSTTGTLWARQLFKDVSGTPTTVIKTSSDQLRITYEYRVYPPTADTTQTGLVISGTSYNITTRAREIDTALMWGFQTGFVSGMLNGPQFGFGTPGGHAFDASSVLGATTGSPTGTNISRSSATTAAYVNGTFYRDVTMKWEPADGNLAGGIGGISSYGGDTTETFQSVFTPVFAKDSTKRLTLVVRCSWARYP